MQEFIALSFGVLVGGFIGFNVGVKRIVDKAEVAAQNFIDALRDRFGSVVEREVEVGEDEFGDIVRRNKVSRIKVESNMGHGLFEINLRAVFNATKDLQHMAQARGINGI